MMFRAAILKLTGQYVLLAMIMSIVFSFVFYGFAVHELSEGLHNQFHALSTSNHDGDSVSDPLDHISSLELNARSNNLKTDLITFNLFVLIASISLGYLLARRTLKPIEEAHASQVRFTADASHELRTPISAMKADTESILMEKNPSLKLLRQGLQSNLRDIERLERLSSHLLSMARYKSAANQNIEPVDLKPLLGKIVNEAKRSYKTKALKLNKSLEPIVINAEPLAMEQLFTIVIDNAMKYSKHKGSVTISLKSSKDQAIIVVKDHGIGITNADIQHVFEYFYRSTTAQASDVASGYGLGLPLAHDIVELYKGKITLESIESAGTTVTISLPTSN